MRIKDLPENEKPRERLVKYGVDNISNEDLISIILGSGVKNNNVKKISSKILSKIKSINELNDLSINELTTINGVGHIKAVTLLAALELGKRVDNKEFTNKTLLNSTSLVHKYFSNLIGNKKQEKMLVILVDNKKRLINYKIMYKGTSNASLASPKEIFNYAVRENAEGIIIMHNHPSGIIIPSKADIELTNNLITSGKMIGIQIVDHLITNGSEYYSFFEKAKIT